jgi:hypothetical protein
VGQYLTLFFHQHTEAKDVITSKAGQCTYKRNNEMRSQNHCCRAKAISITYPDCVSVALGIQHAMRMRRICHLWPARLYHIFQDYLTNGRILEIKVIEDKMCVLIFTITFV